MCSLKKNMRTYGPLAIIANRKHWASLRKRSIIFCCREHRYRCQCIFHAVHILLGNLVMKYIYIHNNRWASDRDIRLDITLYGCWAMPGFPLHRRSGLWYCDFLHINYRKNVAVLGTENAPKKDSCTQIQTNCFIPSAYFIVLYLSQDVTFTESGSFVPERGCFAMNEQGTALTRLLIAASQMSNLTKRSGAPWSVGCRTGNVGTT